MENILVSVVMSVYNAENYIKDAISSVLNQSYKDFEFIIINDGSIDNSKNIIESFNDGRIVLYNQENKGLSKALNFGINKAKGLFIARMDADDICHANRIEEQLNFFKTNHDYIAIGSNATLIDKDGNFLYETSVAIDWQEIKYNLPNVPFYHSSTMFKKEAFLKSGGYPENVPHFIEDKILWMRMAQYGKYSNIERPLIKYRIVPTSITNEKSANPFINDICEKVYNGEPLNENEQSVLFKSRQKVSQKKLYAAYFKRIGKIYLEKGINVNLAKRNLKKSLKYDAFDLVTWFNYFLSILPVFYIKKWKKYRKAI